MKVAITYNIKKGAIPPGVPSDLYAEWDDEGTIEAIRQALASRYEATLIEADENAYRKLRAERPDLVFNIAEGLRGESRESHIPAILEMLQIPYTGSGPLTLALCLDKVRAKEVLGYHSIPTPRFFVVNSPLTTHHSPLSFPLIVKPLSEGSSKGIRDNSVVWDEDGLKERVEWVVREYKQAALVEEFLQGREFTVALLGNERDLKVLPIIEIDYSTLTQGVKPIYSYEAKWIWDRPEAPLNIFICPAILEECLREEIEDICRRAFHILNVKDWCRIDLRLDSNGKPNILELNPLPGILPNPQDNSCFPKAARCAGMDYSTLINTVVDIACKRYRI
ncbi:MAG: ATP-grasp domain-containing protein [Deltaproteobacteria bacterium]|nr:ATP-grasp domain-containing protein [Deltaproteobacteria bacterium]